MAGHAPDPEHQADVVIVGLGPCGATVANHLGLYGVRTIVVERMTEIIDYPRAVGMDDEALRSFQTVGLAERLLDDMVRNVPARYYTAKGRCFAHVHPQGQPFGWPRRNIFIQPLAEATLRAGLADRPSVRLLLGHELTALSQDAGHVVATVRDSHGTERRIVTRYLVGTDGGRSTVRSIANVPLLGSTDVARWLVVDVEGDTLDLPFSGIWTHIHSPRLSIALPYGQRRFEFRIRPGQSDDEIERPETIDRLIGQFYPPGAARPRVRRARVYQHHSRIAERFRVGRVFLAGDAAHLQPPFFGQGMNSGLRDATNLAWKLAAVVRGQAGESLLETYEIERRDHAWKMVKVASMFGALYAPKTRPAEILRDTLFRVLHYLPGARDYITQLRFKPMPRYMAGMVLHRPGERKDSPTGRMLMQPTVETPDRRKLRLDDAIGDWFAILGIKRDPQAHLSAAEREAWRAMGTRFVMIVPSRCAPESSVARPGTIVLEDMTGAFRDWLIQAPDREFIVLRPDRYVAAVSNADDLDDVVAKLRLLIGEGEPVAVSRPLVPALVGV